jgi:hypothetical protein
MYRMPSRPSRHRVALWRELHRLAAVNLLHATWAVPHGESGPADLSHLLDCVSTAGGSASAAEVGGGSAVDDDLCVRLIDACERLWDGFINDVDELEFALADREVDDEREVGDELTALRAQYVELLVQDLVQSGAATRAGCKLQTCADRIVAVAPAALDPAERLRRHHVVRIGEPVGLADGSVRYVATIEPSPSIGWERALVDFETAIYRPDPTRVPIAHGLFVFSCPPLSREPLLEQLQGRVRRFEQSLAE